nr:MAG TPA: regulatory protein [Caudoviricetes sp.]
MLVEIRRISKTEVTVVSSLDVAETFKKNHRDVMESIRNIETAISTAEFSALFHLDSYKASNGKMNPMYLMTRDGFTLLVMGYTGEKAMQFKLAYIKQFNAMEKALQGKLIEREKGIAVRQSLTKALQQSAENERMHGHAYSTYTNCIYKVLFGKNAKQLREEIGISKKDNLRDYLSAEELKAIQSMECLVSGLVDCGWGYDQIKEFIQQNNTMLQIAA